MIGNPAEISERMVLGLAFSLLLGAVARDTDAPAAYLDAEGRRLVDLIEAVHISVSNPADEIAIRQHGAAFARALVDVARMFAGLPTADGRGVALPVFAAGAGDADILSPDEFSRIAPRPPAP